LIVFIDVLKKTGLRKSGFAEKILLSFAVRLFDVLPHRAALTLGALLGALLRVFARRKVDRAEARCVAALGVGVTPARAIVRASFVNMGKSAAEFARFGRLAPRLKSLFSIEGKERLDEVLARGKGAIFMAAHFDNWELAGARMAAEGYSVMPIYTPQRNGSGLNDLISARRAAMGMKMIPSEGFGLRELLRALRGGSIVIFMQDLDARKEGVVVPFLGLPASTATGLVKMHRKFGTPVVAVFPTRNPDGVHHTVHIGKVVSDLLDEDGSPFGTNMEKSLKMCNNILGEWVKSYPEQWMWLLDKWEFTRPF
jgi:KDO2-lipid IV(A) lauroyltransferase